MRGQRARAMARGNAARTQLRCLVKGQLLCAVQSGMGKPSFLPCLLIRDLCCRQGGTRETVSVWGLRAAHHTGRRGRGQQQRATHNVRDDAAARNSGLDQGVQLLVTADGQLQVAGGDALHCEVERGGGAGRAAACEPASGGTTVMQIAAALERKAARARGSPFRSLEALPASSSSSMRTRGAHPCAVSGNCSTPRATLPTNPPPPTSGQVLEDGGRVHGSGGTHAAVGGGAALRGVGNSVGSRGSHTSACAPGIRRAAPLHAP